MGSQSKFAPSTPALFKLQTRLERLGAGNSSGLDLPEVATASVNSLPGVWLHRRDRGAVSGCSAASSPNSRSDGDSRCPPESDPRPQNRLPIAALWHRSSLCRSRTAADTRSAADRYDDGILGTLRILDRAARQDMELPHRGERAPSECPGTDARRR